MHKQTTVIKCLETRLENTKMFKKPYVEVQSLWVIVLKMRMLPALLYMCVCVLGSVMRSLVAPKPTLVKRPFI